MHQAQHTEAAQRDGLDMLGSLKKICAYVWNVASDALLMPSKPCNSSASMHNGLAIKYGLFTSAWRPYREHHHIVLLAHIVMIYGVFTGKSLLLTIHVSLHKCIHGRTLQLSTLCCDRFIFVSRCVATIVTEVHPCCYKARASSRQVHSMRLNVNDWRPQRLFVCDEYALTASRGLFDTSSLHATMSVTPTVRLRWHLLQPWLWVD